MDVKTTIENLKEVLTNTEHEVDFEVLKSSYEALVELAGDKDIIHRYEVVATGYIYDVNYIHHKDKQNGLVKFLLEKMKRDNKGNAIRGRIACIMDDSKLTTDLRNGDRVKIWADFSPYETHREDGMTFHKIKLWVDKLERVDRGISNYVPRKNYEMG